MLVGVRVAAAAAVGARDRGSSHIPHALPGIWYPATPIAYPVSLIPDPLSLILPYIPYGIPYIPRPLLHPASLMLPPPISISLTPSLSRIRDF